MRFNWSRFTAEIWDFIEFVVVERIDEALDTALRPEPVTEIPMAANA